MVKITWYRHPQNIYKGVSDIIDFIEGNEHGILSSNLGWGCLHFSECQ